jgi:anti-anti-sigma factor
MPDYAIERRERHCHVILLGDLTASKVPDLQAALKGELAAGMVDVTIDLKNTAMLDSTGIGLLISTGNSVARQKGKLAVINVSPDVVRLLQSMRLTNRLDVRGREAEDHHG